MPEKFWNLVCYDVRDAKRLRRVAKHLEGYGQRIQYSIFRCRLDNETLEKLHWELSQIMKEEDDLLIIPLCQRCAASIPRHSTNNPSDWRDPPPTYRIL